MKVEEMALRSEIRQMLNEAGFNRNTIKDLVKESINDIVENQVNQVLMERKEQNMEKLVSDYINKNIHRDVRQITEDIIERKLRWMNFDLNINFENRE